MRGTISHAQQAQRLRVEVHTPYTLTCLFCGEPLHGGSWAVVNGWSCCRRASCSYNSRSYAMLALLQRRNVAVPVSVAHSVRWYYVRDAEHAPILDARECAIAAAERGLFPRP